MWRRFVELRVAKWSREVERNRRLAALLAGCPVGLHADAELSRSLRHRNTWINILAVMR